MLQHSSGKLIDCREEGGNEGGGGGECVMSG
jgi:hypothetical protein